MSWIALDDLVEAYVFALLREDLDGPVVATAPQPVENAEFTRVLGDVLGRPTVLRVPPAVLRGALGELADEMLLASARVVPSRLADAGFSFAFPALEGALRMELGRLRAEDVAVPIS